MPDAILELTKLNSWRGSAHVVQDLELSFTSGRLAVVGRNGMGKSTLCDTVTGLLALEPSGRVEGSARLLGQEIVGSKAHRISRMGIGYVPQGRRVFGSLNVEDCLRVAQRKGGPWTAKRVYELFPRLAERRKVGSGQLSGGEQQMLAIGRALVVQPKLLIMDEPSEGLAPVIVDQLVTACHQLANDGMHLIVVEQNLSVALALAENVVVIDNGRITAELTSSALRDDPELKRRHLGIASAAD